MPNDTVNCGLMYAWLALPRMTKDYLTLIKARVCEQFKGGNLLSKHPVAVDLHFVVELCIASECYG